MTKRLLRNGIIQFSFIFFICFLVSCEKEKKADAVEKDSLALSYGVRAQWAHDTGAFTQGLVIHNGKLFESTGQNGSSWIGIVDINSGKADKKVILDKAYFGEGITILNSKIYQLTYKNKIGFIYDLKTFKRLGEFEFSSSQGWGITHDNKNLIMSDGSENLTYLDTTILKPVKTLKVSDESGSVKNLNELEYIEGFIYANIWQTNRIVKIDPASGKVVGRLDLSQLAQDAQMLNPRVDVLNGIAYHPTTKLMLVTGKYWPMIYVIQVQ